MEEPTSLVLREECCQDSVIVALAGELDTVSERHVTGLVTRLLEKEARRVLFDLSGVQFLDTAGIRGLISAQRRLVTADGGGHAESGVGVDVVCAEEAFDDLVGEVVFLGEALA